MSESTTALATPIVARAGRYYRNVRFLLAAGAIIMGCWFGYDGLVRWPAENATIAQLNKQYADANDRNDRAAGSAAYEALKQHTPHTSLDLLIQRVLAFGLPPVGLLIAGWAIYNSRGRVTFDGQTLCIPGHPPIHVDAITAFDKSVWDRKGMAHVEYELPAGQTGRARLDDFVYERKPIDAIADQLTALLQAPAGEAPAA